MNTKAPIWSSWVFWIVILLLYGPPLIMFAGAFSGSTNWFLEVFRDRELLNSMFRSLFIGFFSAGLATFVGTLAAIANFDRAGTAKKWLDGMTSMSLSLPEIVFALSLLSWFVILQFELGTLTVVIAHVTFSLAYVITTVRGRLTLLDPSWEDAARDLGASEIQILLRITLPCLKPALVSSFLLCFLLSFDDFLITFFVNGAGNDTLPIKLYTSIKYGMTPKLNALASFLFLLSVLIMTLGNRVAHRSNVVRLPKRSSTPRLKP